MMIRLKLMPWLALALVLFGGCSADEVVTEVVITIDADQALRAKLTRVEVESYDSEQLTSSEKPSRIGHETFWIKSAAKPDGVTFSFSFGAVKNKSDTFLLVVAGFEGDRLVLEQKSKVAFVPGKSGALTIALKDTCYEKLCGGERGTSAWLQSSCESDEGTCSGVMMPPTMVMDEDDAGTTSTEAGVSVTSDGGSGSGGASAEAGSQSGGGGGSDGGARDGGSPGPMDGGGNNPTDGGGNPQSDTGTSSPNDSGARDTGSTTPDASGCPANHFQTPGGCVPHFTSLSSNGDTVGGGTNCARRADNTVACWGRNIHGQFGNGSEEQSVTRAVVVAALAQAVEIAVGSNFICHRRADGTVYCAGGNLEGTLGRGVAGDSTVPVQVMGLTGAVELAAGSEHACARKSDGTVVCWGNNEAGQLGAGPGGPTPRALAPVAVAGLNNVVEIAAGGYHACARRSEAGVSSVVCWGANSSGQLGNSTTTSSPSFVQVTSLNNAIGLALGEGHSCALLMGGGIACWGSDSFGQLGNAEGSTNQPAPVVNITDAVEVAANRFYSCARRMNGSVTCWGAWPGRDDGGFGPLVKVQSGALEIGGGYFHTCVRKSDGNVVCWGENRYGQIGDGMTTPVGGPYVVTPATVIYEAVLSSGQL